MRSKSCHHLFSCGNRGVNVRFGVGGGEESGLEGAGGKLLAASGERNLGRGGGLFRRPVCKNGSPPLASGAGDCLMKFVEVTVPETAASNMLNQNTEGDLFAFDGSCSENCEDICDFYHHGAGGGNCYSPSYLTGRKFCWCDADPTYLCHPSASCVDGSCECDEGFEGDGIVVSFLNDAVCACDHFDQRLYYILTTRHNASYTYLSFGMRSVPPPAIASASSTVTSLSTAIWLERKIASSSTRPLRSQATTRHTLAIMVM